MKPETPAASKQGEDGAKYVLVDAAEKTTPVEATNDTETKEVECPDIVYKVQYKDLSGEIKGTKILDAPYKLKKTTYGGGGTPILEVLYSVAVWFPSIYKRGVGNKKNLLEKADKTDEDGKEIFDEKSMEEKELIIHSELIIKALRAIVDYYPGQSLLGNTVTIKEPFSILVHHREELEAYKQECDDEETFHHITVLQKWLADNLGEKILEEDARYARSTPVATFEMLWMLFKPGMDVYAQIDEQRGGFVVQSCTPTSAPGLTQVGSMKVIMWYLDFDGVRVGRRKMEVTIAPFEGEREITSLKAFPSKYIDGNEELSPRKRLEDRGEKFYKLLMGKQMDYKGYSMHVKEKPKRWSEGRVVVDQGSFYTYADWADVCAHPAPNFDVDDDNTGILADLHYDCSCEECNQKRQAASINTKWGSYENIDPKETPDLSIDKDGNPTRHRYFLFPRRIMGFDIKSKKWQALDVDYCRDPKIKTEAIENLVLPSDKQDLIKALVHKYSTSRNRNKNKPDLTWSADPIPNKGEGQIFLLHGPPGAGKTFTAECVAEFTSRPLLSLTCGDIGTHEVRVEESLSKWFKLAEIWGAVMLIDEADVYLERREVNELTRNGLVSVFLRAMEYYRGILFLTTNRVGHFDPAFFSRIHVTIGYKPLDLEGRKRIWLQFFQKLESERGDEVNVKAGAKRYILSEDVLEDTDWNGREIRNAFQTAVALAEYEAMQKIKKAGGEELSKSLDIELRQDHFEKVVEMSDNFKKYLASVKDSESQGDRGNDNLL